MILVSLSGKSQGRQEHNNVPHPQTQTGSKRMAYTPTLNNRPGEYVYDSHERKQKDVS